MTPLSIAAEAAATAFAQARALRRRGRDADAILWFQEAVRREPALGPASFEAGELCLWHGRTDEAERHLGDALRWAVAACSGLPRPRQGKGMDPGAARTALFAALDALAAAGIVAFLNGGTALGCVREGNFISFDSDIDLGVAPGTAPDSVVPGAVIEAIDAAPGLHYRYHDVHAGQVLRVRFASEGGIGGASR